MNYAGVIFDTRIFGGVILVTFEAYATHYNSCIQTRREAHCEAPEAY